MTLRLDLPLPGDPIDPGDPASRSRGWLRWLSRAVELVGRSGTRALVTAPIAKHLWHQAGHVYPGQTERLAELAGSPSTSMLFTAISPHTGWRLNTLLATTHIPLSQVSQVLSPDLVEHKLGPCCQLLQFRRAPSGGRSQSPCRRKGQLGSEERMARTLAASGVRHPAIRLRGPTSAGYLLDQCRAGMEQLQVRT